MMQSKRLLPNSYVFFLGHVLLVVVGWVGWDSESVLWKSVGASLIATGVAGWVLFLYVRASETTSERLEVLAESGIVRAFTKRGAVIREEYDKRLAGAKETIDVMGFGLRALREDYLRDFETWKTRARVRILLMDPEFPTQENSFAAHRDTEEGNTAGDIRKEVNRFIEETRHLLDDRFEVRLYRTLPSINIFRVDDELFWGPYLLREQSRNTPTFIVRRRGTLFDPIMKHFDAVWASMSHPPRC